MKNPVVCNFYEKQISKVARAFLILYPKGHNLKIVLELTTCILLYKYMWHLLQHLFIIHFILKMLIQDSIPQPFIYQTSAQLKLELKTKNL